MKKEKMTQQRADFICSIANRLHERFNIPVWTALFIGCQFALESAFGTSDLAKSFCNYCGMRLPKVRINSANNFDSSDLWAHYDSLDDCILDYVLCIQYHRPMAIDLENEYRYSRFLKRFYCPETDYIDKIYTIFKQLKNFRNGKEK